MLASSKTCSNLSLGWPPLEPYRAIHVQYVFVSAELCKAVALRHLQVQVVSSLGRGGHTALEFSTLLVF